MTYRCEKLQVCLWWYQREMEDGQWGNYTVPMHTAPSNGDKKKENGDVLVGFKWVEISLGEGLE